VEVVRAAPFALFSKRSQIFSVLKGKGDDANGGFAGSGVKILIIAEGGGKMGALG